MNNFWNTQSNFTLISIITFEVVNETSTNSQGNCRSTSRWCLQNYMDNGWELTSELTSKWITFKNTQSNFTLISLITFEVINETPPNLQGSCRNTCRWCLQNYMENGWELTSELTSKWKTFKNTQSNFTLISLITFEVINETPPNLQGSCRNTCRWCLQNYMENGHHRQVLRQLPCKFGGVSLITSKVINEISVKFDWVFLKVIHLDVNSDVNSQPLSM